MKSNIIKIQTNLHRSPKRQRFHNILFTYSITYEFSRDTFWRLSTVRKPSSSKNTCALLWLKNKNASIPIICLSWFKQTVKTWHKHAARSTLIRFECYELESFFVWYSSEILRARLQKDSRARVCARPNVIDTRYKLQCIMWNRLPLTARINKSLKYYVPMSHVYVQHGRKTYRCFILNITS